VLNERPNVPRAQYDRLKAILTNCLRHGPAGQNHENRADFRSHLMGRIAYVASIHPGRGARLSALLGQIAW
jgi:RNA-directed DNA polymerase